MGGNRHKPDANPVSAGLALIALQTWLRQEAGNQKLPLVLGLLASKTQTALDRGELPPAVAPDTLREIYRHEYGETGNEEPRRWLPSREMGNWWAQRARPISEACRAAGADCVPILEIIPGGGRGNPTTYRISFQTNDTADAEPSEQEATNPGLVRYSKEPAKAAFWLSLVIGKAPFRMRSWRGYLLLLLTAAPVLVWGLLVIYGFLVLNTPRPVTAQDILLVLLLAILGLGVIQAFRPMARLPEERVTLAGDAYLAYGQIHGQFRLSRDSQSRKLGGWFSLVRHYGTCPACSGVVELAKGGSDFPGRLVGRCEDSPLEHVYSFDPVSFEGRPLR